MILDGDFEITVLDGDYSEETVLDGDFEITVFDGDFGEVLNISDVPEYQGVYEVTPSEEGQVLMTNGFRMGDNVVIGAIPQNYGLLTWNGSTLRVS